MKTVYDPQKEKTCVRTCVRISWDHMGQKQCCQMKSGNILSNSVSNSVILAVDCVEGGKNENEACRNKNLWIVREWLVF